jgi:hypothetical protein
LVVRLAALLTGIVLDRVVLGQTGHERFRPFRSRGLAALPSGRGDTRVLVLVVRFAGGASGLLDLVLDHRDHRVVGDAALARTVVVQNVTEPKPALLH